MRSKQTKKWQIIEIEWVDSIHTNGWTYEDKLDLDDKYLNHKTVGYFYTRTKHAITVVQSRSNDGDEKSNVDATMTIPLLAIQKIKKL